MNMGVGVGVSSGAVVVGVIVDGGWISVERISCHSFLVGGLCERERRVRKMLDGLKRDMRVSFPLWRENMVTGGRSVL